MTRHPRSWLPPATTASEQLITELLEEAGIPCVEPPVIMVRMRTMPDATEEEVHHLVKSAVEQTVTADGALAVDARSGVLLALGPTSQSQLSLVEAHVAVVLDAWADCLSERSIKLERDELAERVVEIIVAELLAVRRASLVPA